MDELRLIQQSDVASLLEILQREQRILEDLESRLWSAGTLIVSQRDRALAGATARIAEVERELGTTEMLRALVVAGIAENWGVPEHDFSLRAIIRLATPQQAEALGESLERLRAMVGSLDSLRHSLTRLARQRLEESLLAEHA